MMMVINDGGEMEGEVFFTISLAAYSLEPLQTFSSPGTGTTGDVRAFHSVLATSSM